MGRWTDIAAWAGPIPNCGPGPMGRVMGMVVHTAEGSYDGTIAWQRNPAAQVGSHFINARDGRRSQMIDTDIRSWCQSAGNDNWISSENEGFGSRGEALTPQQLVSNAEEFARLVKENPHIPLQVSNSPSTPGLGWHGMGGAAWGGHYDCPGLAIKAQLPTIVALAAEIINGGTVMGLREDPDGIYVLFRVEAADKMLDTYSDGPEKGKPVPHTAAVKEIQTHVRKIDVLGVRLDTLLERTAQPAPASVAMTDADRQAIIAGVVAQMPKPPTAAEVAEELARRISNG